MSNNNPVDVFVNSHNRYLTISEQRELKDLLYLFGRTQNITRLLELYSIARMEENRNVSSEYELGKRDVLFELRKLLSNIK